MSNLVNQVVEELSKVEGLSKILVAEHGAYKGFLPGNQENLNCNTLNFLRENNVLRAMLLSINGTGCLGKCEISYQAPVVQEVDNT